MCLRHFRMFLECSKTTKPISDSDEYVVLCSKTGPYKTIQHHKSTSSWISASRRSYEAVPIFPGVDTLFFELLIKVLKCSRKSSWCSLRVQFVIWATLFSPSQKCPGNFVIQKEPKLLRVYFGCFLSTFWEIDNVRFLTFGKTLTETFRHGGGGANIKVPLKN